MNKALEKIPAYLNMRHLEVTPEYKLNFLKANATFMHMFVYDPRIRKMVRLTEPSECDVELCSNAGSMLDDKTAFQLALGNLDPFTLNKLDNWDPEQPSIKVRSFVNQMFTSILMLSCSGQDKIRHRTQKNSKHLAFFKRFSTFPIYRTRIEIRTRIAEVSAEIR